jgi:S-formylglutathione hydrolase FrmB
MKATDFLIAQGNVDSSRMAAAGGSYGGFMTDWIEGHTDRFKCLVSHDGMFNTESAFGTTEGDFILAEQPGNADAWNLLGQIEILILRFDLDRRQRVQPIQVCSRLAQFFVSHRRFFFLSRACLRR